MKTVCEKKSCTGCKACVNVCSKSAITIKDSIVYYNAEIDPEKCINCGLCEKACPNINLRSLQHPIYWKQGWAVDEIRKNASSGGAASAIIRAFIASGGYVASCLFEEGEFGFKITDDIGTAKRFAGSKYVKSNPGTVYKEIRQLLKADRKVLFIGLPCQSAAVQNICRNHENLTTADLICHGTPSPKLLMKYLSERGIDWKSVSEIKFRDNEYFGLAANGKRLVPRRVTDSYLLTFLNSINYTENCYSCRYATIDRVSDITLGDAWGQLSNEIPGGVSLVLCQTQKGIDLVESARLHLEEVDLEKAVKDNHQLEHPSIKPPGRDKFMKCIKNGGEFRKAAIVVLPKDCVKQSVKSVLIKMHILKDFWGD